MPKDTIQLNADKARLRIAVAGGPIKAIAVGLSEKTIHRIKKGKRTSLATARRLAANLGTSVEDLLLPPARDEVVQMLPRNWLYDDAPAAPIKTFDNGAGDGGDGGQVLGRLDTDTFHVMG